jgi:hypothetical protein
MKKSSNKHVNNFLQCVQEEVILTSLMLSFEELNSETLKKIKVGIDFILNERNESGKTKQV